MKYRIVSSKGKFGLESNVNEALKYGWVPMGGVATDKDGYFYQAMTKSTIEYPIKVEMATERGWIDVGEIA